MMRNKLLSGLNKDEFEKSWPAVLYHVGETYRRLGLYEEALEYFNDAISLDGRNYLPYFGRAIMWKKLGNVHKAKEDINIAKSISDSVEIKYYKEILGL